MSLTVIILTYNESIHIERCINSLSLIAEKIVVVDSFSQDRTCEISESLGATVFRNPFANQAQQFQWAIDNCDIDTEWVLRLDADEYLETDLLHEITTKLPNLPTEIKGVCFKRKHIFMGRWVKYGDRYPLVMLRLFRKGCAHIEQRWMDEHIVLDEGKSITFDNDFADDNLNTVGWFIDKHNKYAAREMIDVIGREFGLFADDDQISGATSKQASLKRFLKTKLYNKLPPFVGPFFYFIYRYFLRLGFLDGVTGFGYHFMQGFWYRCLVDLRVYEAKQKIGNETNPEKIKIILTELTGLKI